MSRKKKPRRNPPFDRGGQTNHVVLPSGLEIKREGGLTLQRLIPGADPTILQQELLEEGRTATRELERIADELRSHFDKADPILLITHVVFFFLIGPDHRSDPRHFSTRDSLIEYLCGIAASLSSTSADPPDPQQSFEVFEKLLLIPALLEAAYLAQKLEESRTGTSVDDLRFHLGLEQLFDRMEGYVPHLELMYAEVFAPIRQSCTAELGFWPGHIPAVVRAIVQRKREVFEEVSRTAFGSWKRPEMSELRGTFTRAQRLALSANFLLSAFSSRLAYEDIDDISARSGITTQEVEKLLELFVCPFGSQPDFRLPNEVNLLRYRPVLRDRNGYFIPLPWSLLHNGLRTFSQMLNGRGSQPLLRHFYRSRDRATESIIRRRLESIFDRGKVLSPVNYSVGSDWAEADALVLLKPHAVVAEAKAHSFTESGRRGAPGRLKTKIGELLYTPAGQAFRLAEALISGHAMVMTSSGSAIPIPDIKSTSLLVVTFERVDPLSHGTAALLDETKFAGGVWVVCLADFLMVCDLLTRPSEFLAYLWLRTSLASNKRMRSVMEADLLGGFLYDHLLEFRSQLASSEGILMLGYSAREVNDYFTFNEMGIPTQRPRTGIPVEVLERLDELIRSSNPSWPILLQRTFDQHPVSWRRLNRILTRVRRTGMPRALSFDDPPLEVKVSADDENAGTTQATDPPVLLLRV